MKRGSFFLEGGGVCQYKHAFWLLKLTLKLSDIAPSMKLLNRNLFMTGLTGAHYALNKADYHTTNSQTP